MIDGQHNPYLDESQPLFFGRRHFMVWLSQRLCEPGASRLPIVLYGPPKIGKSMLIRELVRARLGGDLLPILIDWAEPQWQEVLQSEEETWAAIALEIKRQLSDFDVPTASTGDLSTTLSAASFAYAGFRDDVLPDLLSMVGTPPALLLFDHIDAIIDRPEFHAFLTHWRHLTEKHDALFLLLTLRDHPDRYGQGVVSGEAYALGTLESEPAERLLREPVPYYLDDPLIEYVTHHTHGHPYALQAFGHALFKRWETGQMVQPMMTDMVLALRRTQAETPSNGTTPHVVIPIKSAVGPHGRRRGMAVGAALFAAVFVILLLGLWWFDRPLWGRSNLASVGIAVVDQAAAPDKIAAAPPSPTPTATLTPTTTATPTLAPSATPTPQPTPTAVIIVATIPPTPTPENTVREIDQMPLIFVGGGRFMRGSAEADPFSEPDEQPQREVTIDPFFIDQFEVTMAQYATFLNDIGDHRTGCGGAECARVSPDVQGTYILQTTDDSGAAVYSVLSGYERVPVTHVSWIGARAYCEWVNGRLPTEAEWEFAARGTDGRLYPWGNEPPDRTRAIYETELVRLLAVDSLPAGVSPFGAFGMAGSVWEWVNDWYDAEYYEWGIVDNPPGPSGGVERVTRGGSWAQDNDASRIRSNNRNFFKPAALRADVGFRCAADVAQVVENAD